MNRTLAIAILVFALAAAAAPVSYSQNNPYEYVMVEEKPTFEGDNLMQIVPWLLENIQLPATVDRELLKGKVGIYTIIIGTEGKLTEVQALRPVSKEVDEAVTKTLMNSEGWTPGKQRGTPVAVKAMIKVTF